MLIEKRKFLTLSLLLFCLRIFACYRREPVQEPIIAISGILNLEDISAVAVGTRWGDSRINIEIKKIEEVEDTAKKQRYVLNIADDFLEVIEQKRCRSFSSREKYFAEFLYHAARGLESESIQRLCDIFKVRIVSKELPRSIKVSNTMKSGLRRALSWEEMWAFLPPSSRRLEDQ